MKMFEKQQFLLLYLTAYEKYSAGVHNDANTPQIGSKTECSCKGAEMHRTLLTLHYACTLLAATGASH